jgi:starch phosphorylase
MKNSIRTLAPAFNTDRMVQEYTEQMYIPCHKLVTGLTMPTLDSGLQYAAWRAKLNEAWRSISIQRVDIPQETLKVGDNMEVKAIVQLGQLKPDDVQVQLYYGLLTQRGEIGIGGSAVNMQLVGANGSDGSYTFRANINYDTSGERGISVRVLPHHPSLPTAFLPGMIRWADK